MKERRCSYEVSKLLKEKGFKEWCTHCYSDMPTHNGEYLGCDEEYELEAEGRGDEIVWIEGGMLHHLNSRNDDAATACPTHQMASDWLRENYDLHIIAFPYKADKERKWCCYVYKTFNLLGYEKYINETLDSYKEAVEAALKYALENLIEE